MKSSGKTARVLLSTISLSNVRARMLNLDDTQKNLSTREESLSSLDLSNIDETYVSFTHKLCEVFADVEEGKDLQ